MGMYLRTPNDAQRLLPLAHLWLVNSPLCCDTDLWIETLFLALSRARDLRRKPAMKAARRTAARHAAHVTPKRISCWCCWVILLSGFYFQGPFHDVLRQFVSATRIQPTVYILSRTVSKLSSFDRKLALYTIFLHRQARRKWNVPNLKSS